MIIKSLNDYYYRLKDQGVNIPVDGYQESKIYGCIVLNKNGTIRKIMDLCTKGEKGNKVFPSLMHVPQMPLRGLKLAAGLAWDNTQYIFGQVPEKKKTMPKDRIKACFDEFRTSNRSKLSGVKDPSVQVFVRFLDNLSYEDAVSFPIPEDLIGSQMVFRVEGDDLYIHEFDSVKQICSESVGKEDDDENEQGQEGSYKEVLGRCIITGEDTVIARMHPKIRNLNGGQASGSSLVSFNAESLSYFGKDQGSNAPISEKCAYAYGTALNYLLRRSPENRQKVCIGNTTYVFWAEKDTVVSDCLCSFLSGYDPAGENGVLNEKVRKFMTSVKSGEVTDGIDTELSDKFYILGLYPNAGRVVVKCWEVCTVDEILHKMQQHYSDMSIEANYTDKDGVRPMEFPAIRHILSEVCSRKDKNGVKDKEIRDIPQPAVNALFDSIMRGGQYPRLLYNMAMDRVISEGSITPRCAAIIKGYHNRRARVHGKKGLNMSLDTENTATGYLLGRLFSMIEKAQKDANPTLNKTIRSNYYRAASMHPRSVFPSLMQTLSHTLPKSDYGKMTNNKIMDIVSKLPADNPYPARLSLDEQGLFSVGYYHQTNEWYTKSEN